MATLVASSHWSAAVDSEAAALSLAIGLLSLSTTVSLHELLLDLREWCSFAHLAERVRDAPEVDAALFAKTIGLQPSLNFAPE